MIASETDARAYLDDFAGPEAMERLECLVAALRDENIRQNLVSAKSLDSVWQRHIADSAQLLNHVPRGTAHWLDLGSGAGFPGLVLAILQPQRRVTLVESRTRRVEWLGRMIDDLGLGNCDLRGRRLETVPDFAAGAITARAFAPLDRLLDLTARFATSDTMWVLPKGRSGRTELDQLGTEWRSLFHVEQSVTDPDAAILVAKGRPGGRKRA